MAKVKLSSSIINPFHCDGDVVAWLKVRLVTRVQKIEDVTRPLPLYFEGDTLKLHLEMEKDQQMNIDLIEAWLKGPFSDGAFSACTKLKLVR